jgi:methylmalonyl-CoA/ethylmalonyl-CoA epimerase
MKLNKIDHIGIAVNNLDEVKSIYETVFEIEPLFVETVEDQKVKTLGYDINGTNIEFLESTDSESPVQRFIDKRGNAVHHIALQVDDLDTKLDALKQKGVRLIDEEPRIGAEGKRIAFIHPKSTGGILIELSETKIHE